MNLVIDLGNTNLKCAIFDDELLIDRLSIHNNSSEYLKFLDNYKITNSLFSGSGNLDHHILQYPNLGALTHFNRSLVVDKINIKYKSPETLGQDRTINAIAASYYFPQMDNLIIDLGSCMTLTMIDKDNNLMGGSISPGYFMRAQSLNEYTHSLPMVDLKNNSKLIGETTHESIISGVQRGMTMEINTRIEEFKSKYPEINVILTGGDAPFFENRIKYKIFADSDFTLKGLNLVLKGI